MWTALWWCMDRRHYFLKQCHSHAAVGQAQCTVHHVPVHCHPVDSCHFYSLARPWAGLGWGLFSGPGCQPIAMIWLPPSEGFGESAAVQVGMEKWTCSLPSICTDFLPCLTATSPPPFFWLHWAEPHDLVQTNSFRTASLDACPKHAWRECLQAVHLLCCIF